MVENGIINQINTKNNFNKLVFHPLFRETINEINDLKIKIPDNPSDLDMDFSLYNFPPNAKTLVKVESEYKYKLNEKKGQSAYEKFIVSAYDESIDRFIGLEGTAYLTSHSLIVHGINDYIPLNLLTFYYYTRSNLICDNSKYIKYADDPEIAYKKDYIEDRLPFLVDNTPKDTILFIDGPLIGGQMTHYTLELNDKLIEKDIIPIFFVKNSNSNLVTQYDKNVKGKYNSDLHWAYRLLKTGERTCLYQYTDPIVKRNSKLFCYIKGLNVSPQRIEFDIKVYEKYSTILDDIFNLIYYLILAQGDHRNPQVRPIAIAEMFARQTIKIINFIQLMRDLGITPTMNQERFG